MKKQILRTSATITKQNVCYLDDISKQTKFSGGKKFSRNKVINTLMRVATFLDVDLCNVKSEKELETRFQDSFKNYGKLNKHK